MHEILQEVEEKFGEWLEMAGEKSPQLLIDILARMIVLERNKNAYLTKLVYHGTRIG